MTDDHDARVALRVPITLCAEMETADQRLSCFTIDLSTRGVFVETFEPIAPGTRVGVEFDVEQGELSADVVASGVVVRRTTPAQAIEGKVIAGLGVRFDSVDAGARELGYFLADRLASLRPTGAARKGIERRRDPRIEVRLPVRWGELLPPVRAGFLRNLSASGGFVLEATQPVEAGARIFMTLELPAEGRSRIVTARASVIRTVAAVDGQPAGMGIRFERAHLETEVLEVFVKRRLEWVRTMAQRAAEGIEHGD
jgi:Tfp pilus assembly protein PilZ